MDRLAVRLFDSGHGAGKGSGSPAPLTFKTVSYTHLTLPTIGG